MCLVVPETAVEPVVLLPCAPEESAAAYFDLVPAPEVDGRAGSG